MEWQHVIATAALALASWALKTSVEHSNRITALESKLESDRGENGRRFEELKSSIQEIKSMLLEALKHRRAGDNE